MNPHPALLVAGLFFGMALSPAFAETTQPAPSQPHAAATTALAKPATATAPVTTAPASTVRPVAPATRPATPAMPVAPDTTTVAAPPVLTPEQRHQQELLANAERVDTANRDLLAKNQELQLMNENLSLQNNQLKHDRSSDGIWKGAFAVIIGFLMGWYFSGGRRRSNW